MTSCKKEVKYTACLLDHRSPHRQLPHRGLSCHIHHAWRRRRKGEEEREGVWLQGRGGLRIFPQTVFAIFPLPPSSFLLPACITPCFPATGMAYTTNKVVYHAGKGASHRSLFAVLVCACISGSMSDGESRIVGPTMVPWSMWSSSSHSTAQHSTNEVFANMSLLYI